ncbi:DUF7289 family protein [Natrialbaceae archaeon AArc-T1-2]|uniref:DUF7289 family protein n=1 Tax=Natrialbaceae archaeon AArc-T1-2 TaxID=3053904 RepID=UPI00255B1FD4|nr:hypothetical protein [Natrialbaceae archaeon AArc-T1-2]WIV67942.1 hypothetical protein QQ977_04205 [Natrialbaceae archaeon AArc-T1-2]
MTSERAQTAVLGVVLLVGVVAIASVGILMLAAETTEELEQQAENERIEQSFVELSQTMSTTSATGDTTEVVDFAAGEHGAVVMTETGHINISADGPADFEENISIGTIEYEADDGTRIAYQAGGVFRETGTETRVVTAPPIHYHDDTSTFSFPIVEVEEEAQINSGDVTISHADTETYRNLTRIEDSVVQINVTSDYCVGWENYFRGQTQAGAIQESCDENTDDQVVVELGLTDLKGAYEQGLYAVGETGVDLRCESAHQIIAGPVAIEGGVDNDAKECIDEDWRDDAIGIDPDETLPPLDRVIEKMNESVKDSEAKSFDGSDNLEGGNTYYADDGVTIDGQGANAIEANLDEGDITLVIDGDLNIDGELEIKEYEDSRSLDIYLTGNLTIDGTAATDDFEFEDPDGQHISIYGTSSMIVGGQGSEFEGTILAPRHEAALNESPNTAYSGNQEDDCEIEETGEYADVCIDGGNTEIGGAIIAGPTLINADQGNIALRWDEDLEDHDPKLPTDEIVLPPDLTYFNIVEHKVDVEN